jgi:amino acid efflux transporter
MVHITSPAQASLSVPRGVVLQVGALLGPGILLLPGLASAKAGPASILAWAGLLVVSALLAIVFAALGVRYPSEAGVGTYTERGLGVRAGRTVSWCFLAGIVTGGPVVCIIGGNYLAELLHLGRASAAATAAGLLALVVAVTFGGLRVSSGVQLGLLAILVLVVGVAVAVAAGHSRADHWTPFTPHGWSSVGSAASVLMLSFAGWEAIASLTPRFHDPRTQLPRVIAIAFILTSAVYLALAAVIIGALGDAASTTVPLEELLRLGIGSVAAPIAAAAALLLTLANTNAYLTGAGSLARALTLTKPGGNQPQHDHLPAWLLAAIAASGATMIGLDAAGALSTAALVTVPTTFFLAVYLGCTTAAVRLFTGLTRIAAAAAAVAVIAVLCFSGYALLLPAAIALIAVTHAGSGTPRKHSISVGYR